MNKVINNLFAIFNLNKWKSGKIDKTKCMLLETEQGQVYVYTEDGTLLDKNIVIAENGMPTELVPENGDYRVTTPEGEVYVITVQDGIITAANEFLEEPEDAGETENKEEMKDESEAKKDEEKKMEGGESQMLLLTFQKVQNSYNDALVQRDARIEALESKITEMEELISIFKNTASQAPKTPQGEEETQGNFLRKLNKNVEKLVKGK